MHGEEAVREYLQNLLDAGDYENLLTDFFLVRDESGAKVPFRFRDDPATDPQLQYVRDLQRLRREGRQARICELKCRSYGSSLVKGLTKGADLLKYPGSECVVVADTLAKGHDIARKYIYNPLKFMDPRAGVTVSSFGRKTDDVAFELGNESFVRVLTAQSREAMGRGFHPQLGLLSEVAFWGTRMADPEEADNTARALLNGFPSPAKAPQVCVDWESTANGQVGLHWEVCQKAKRGEDDWWYRFVPWFQPGKYGRAGLVERDGWTREDEEAVAEFRKTKGALGQVVDRLGLDEFEIEYILTYPMITWGNLLWRRHYGLPQCKGDPVKFREDFPANDVEAFLASGTPAFDPRAIIHYEGETKSWPTRPMILTRRDGDSWGVEAAQGVAPERAEFKVWRLPEKGEVFVIGGDVALGADGIRGQDLANANSVASVWSLFRFDQVAEWSGQPHPRGFAEVCWRLLRFWNDAITNIERNAQGTEVVMGLQRRRLPNGSLPPLYRFPLRGNLMEVTYCIGAPVNPVTREAILDRFRFGVREHIVHPRSAELLTEMRGMQFKDGKIVKARHLKSDRVFAAAHAVWVLLDEDRSVMGAEDVAEEEFEALEGFPTGLDPNGRNRAVWRPKAKPIDEVWD